MLQSLTGCSVRSRPPLVAVPVRAPTSRTTGVPSSADRPPAARPATVVQRFERAVSDHPPGQALKPAWCAQGRHTFLGAATRRQPRPAPHAKGRGHPVHQDLGAPRRLRDRAGRRKPRRPPPTAPTRAECPGPPGCTAAGAPRRTRRRRPGGLHEPACGRARRKRPALPAPRATAAPNGSRSATGVLRSVARHVQAVR